MSQSSSKTARCSPALRVRRSKNARTSSREADRVATNSVLSPERGKNARSPRIHFFRRSWAMALS